MSIYFSCFKNIALLLVFLLYEFWAQQVYFGSCCRCLETNQALHILMSNFVIHTLKVAIPRMLNQVQSLFVVILVWLEPKFYIFHHPYPTLNQTIFAHAVCGWIRTKRSDSRTLLITVPRAKLVMFHIISPHNYICRNHYFALVY
jgi:hypothetical protein